MKKLMKAITCALVVISCICGCLVGCNGNSTNYDSEIAKLEQQIKDLQNDNSDFSDNITNLQQKIAELEAENKDANDKIAELEQELRNQELRGLNSYYHFFTGQKNEYAYSDFDFSMADKNLSYETGSAENEELFQKIMCGELKYSDYLQWFAANPDYIIRYNVEALNCIESVMREGEFTTELRDKYFGFYMDGSLPGIVTAGMSSVNYHVGFTDDWKVKSVQVNGDFYKPFTDVSGNLKYYLSQNDFSTKAVMPDGKTADCTVYVSYYQTPRTERIWNGEKQEFETVTYLSQCTIDADFNNVYGEGENLFDEILIFTELEGIYNVDKVWEVFKEQATTPSLNLYPGKSEAKIRFLK